MSEEIKEISSDKAHAYADAAMYDLRFRKRDYMNAKTKGNVNRAQDQGRRAQARMNGVMLAIKKIGGSARVPTNGDKMTENKHWLRRPIDEVSKTLLIKYHRAAAHDLDAKSFDHGSEFMTSKAPPDKEDREANLAREKGIAKRKAGMNTAMLKAAGRGTRIKATEETIDEVSNKTLRSYQNNAMNQVQTKSFGHDGVDHDDPEKNRILDKRVSGLRNAFKKLSGQAKVNGTPSKVNESMDMTGFVEVGLFTSGNGKVRLMRHPFHFDEHYVLDGKGNLASGYTGPTGHVISLMQRDGYSPDTDSNDVVERRDDRTYNYPDKVKEVTPIGKGHVVVRLQNGSRYHVHASEVAGRIPRPGQRLDTSKHQIVEETLDEVSSNVAKTLALRKKLDTNGTMADAKASLTRARKLKGKADPKNDFLSRHWSGGRMSEEEEIDEAWKNTGQYGSMIGGDPTHIKMSPEAMEKHGIARNDSGKYGDVHVFTNGKSKMHVYQSGDHDSVNKIVTVRHAGMVTNAKERDDLANHLEEGRTFKDTDRNSERSKNVYRALKKGEKYRSNLRATKRTVDDSIKEEVSQERLDEISTSSLASYWLKAKTDRDSNPINRRKRQRNMDLAVGKITKGKLQAYPAKIGTNEEVNGEKLDEISISLAKNYRARANGAMTRNRRNAAYVNHRQAGTKMATDKIIGAARINAREEANVEESEVNKNKVGTTTITTDAFGKTPVRVFNGKGRIGQRIVAHQRNDNEKHWLRVVKNEETDVMEISDDKLRAYVSKAKDSQEDLGDKYLGARAGSLEDKRAWKKVVSRQAGIDKAEKRLKKEEVDVDEGRSFRVAIDGSTGKTTIKDKKYVAALKRASAQRRHDSLSKRAATVNNID